MKIKKSRIQEIIKEEYTNLLIESNIKDDAKQLLDDLKKHKIIKDGYLGGKVGKLRGGGKVQLWVLMNGDFNTYMKKIKSTYKQVGETQLGMAQFQSPFGFYFWTWNDDGTYAYIQLRRKKK